MTARLFPSRSTPAMSRDIRIINPPGWTSLKQAQAYKHQGRARFVDSGRAIEFLHSSHRHQATVRNMMLVGGMATLEMIRRIPVIQPEKLLQGKPA